MSEHRLMTYAEIAEHFGIGLDGARMKAKRRKWRIVRNHPGELSRVEVPAEWLAERTVVDVPRCTVPDVPRCMVPNDLPTPPDATERSGLVSLEDVRLILGEQLDRQQRAHDAAVRQIREVVQLVQEQADSASVRAERAERMVVRMLTERARAPWWRRWLGGLVAVLLLF